MIMQKLAHARNSGKSATEPGGKALSLFDRIVVILDRHAPYRGAFSIAMDWAARLRVPLVGVVGKAREREPECAAACSQLSMLFESIRDQDRNAADLLSIAGTTGLLVFGDALAAAQKKMILHLALKHAGPGILVCPDAPTAFRRILLLDQNDGDLTGCMPAVATLHHVIGAKIVVLTVAHFEKEVRLRQQSAQEAIANFGLRADYDAVIGSEVRVAVVGVARWRRCQLVVMNRHVSRPWWRWLRDSRPDWFMGLRQQLAFLSLPALGPASQLPANCDHQVSPMTRLGRWPMDTPVNTPAPSGGHAVL
jgi:hypothetical protein